jgi:hypothetical protein
VRWWAALGLLRAAGSSPAAAAATLRERAQGSDTATPEEADELGRRTILDLTDETSEATDVTPGADAEDEAPTSSERRRLLELARAADALRGKPDRKLARGVELVRSLLEDGFHPIVFCKFIETAEYVAGALREALPEVEVEAVTGRLPHAEREQRVAALAEHPRRVLVATDCLSEGINLQDHFDAVLHYDLAWSPTRHEQREGRVDRFGQPRPLVRTVMLYGADNPIDGIVLDVLLRKHRAIRRSLGVSVPVPESESVLEAILEGLLLRGRPDEAIEAQLHLFEMDFIAPRRAEFHRRWDEAAERERRSRTIFAQEGIRAEEVAAELQATRCALGGPADVARFTEDALRALGAAVAVRGGVLEAHLGGTPRALRDVLGLDRLRFRARFDLPVGEGELHLSRTHPVVEGLASFVLDTALDPQAPEDVRVARRAGVIRTRGVQRRTTLLVLRHRFDLVTRNADGTDRRQLAEEAALVAFEGPSDDPTWLSDEDAERVLALTPDANVTPEQARYHLSRVLEGLSALEPALAKRARLRAEAIRQAHERLAAGARLRGVRITVEPKLPPDVLGVYVYLPAG